MEDRNSLFGVFNLFCLNVYNGAVRLGVTQVLGVSFRGGLKAFCKFPGLEYKNHLCNTQEHKTDTKNYAEHFGVLFRVEADGNT